MESYLGDLVDSARRVADTPITAGRDGFELAGAARPAVIFASPLACTATP
jgi:hypothetical protein